MLHTCSLAMGLDCGLNYGDRYTLPFYWEDPSFLLFFGLFARSPSRFFCGSDSDSASCVLRSALYYLQGGQAKDVDRLRILTGWSG